MQQGPIGVGGRRPAATWVAYCIAGLFLALPALGQFGVREEHSTTAQFELRADGSAAGDGFHHAAAARALSGDVGLATQRVLVGLYVLGITSVEQAKGQFGIDAYLYLRSSQGTYSGSCPPVEGSVCPAQDSIGRILVNSKDVTVTTINKFASDANTTTQFRIKGTMTASFQYQAWPFESTQLEVAIEDPIRSNSSLTLLPLDSFTSLSPTVSAPGWNLHAAENRTTIVTRASDVLYRREDASASFSRVSFFILLSRPALSAFLKYLLPPTLILVMQVFAMLITPDSVATRVSMAGSGLVTAVLFHTQLTSQTPPANYLVFADRFMLATYFVIVINGVGSVLVIKAKSRGVRAGTRREAAGWQAHAQSEAVMTASLLAAAFAVLASWLGEYDLGLQVALGATPPLLTLAAVSSAGALLSHWMCGCHCVTPAEVLLAQQRVADRKNPGRGSSGVAASRSTGALKSPATPAAPLEGGPGGASSTLGAAADAAAAGTAHPPPEVAFAARAGSPLRVSTAPPRRIAAAIESESAEMAAAWAEAASNTCCPCHQSAVRRAMSVAHSRRQWRSHRRGGTDSPQGLLLTRAPGYQAAGAVDWEPTLQAE